jgi:chemotaxis protein MotB
MRRRRRREENHERWMVSYADFMTLLFAFFVVLYSSSQVDRARMVKLSTAITAGFTSLGAGAGSGGPAMVLPETSPMPPTAATLAGAESAESVRGKLERGLAQEIERRTVAVREIPEGLVLSLREVGFFDSGSATLRASSMDTFDRLGEVLGSFAGNLRIEGHTDNVPIHTPQFQSNWELSTARASEIIRLLMTREHIAPGRLSAAGYAEYHPVAGNDTEDGRRLNRRVDIVIVAPHEHPVLPPQPVKDSATPAD